MQKFFKYSSYFFLSASIVINLGLCSVIHPQIAAGMYFLFSLILLALVAVLSFGVYKESRQYGSIKSASKIQIGVFVIFVLIFFLYGVSLG